MKKQIALVEIYIHHMTGEEVRISPPENTRQLMLLNLASEKASQWMKQSGAIINFIN